MGFVLSPLEKLYVILLMSPYDFNFVIHFQDTFPHQFGVITKGGCEEMVHNIQCTFDLHLN